MYPYHFTFLRISFMIFSLKRRIWTKHILKIIKFINTSLGYHSILKTTYSWRSLPFIHEYTLMGLPWWLSSEESTPTIQETRFWPLGQGDSPGGEHGDPLQYLSRENPTDSGVWGATAHGVTESTHTYFISAPEQPRCLSTHISFISAPSSS